MECKPPIPFQMFGKTWEIPHLDTWELWKFGDWKSFISLKLMAHIFGVPTPKDDIDGSMVSSIYYIEKDLPRIVKYCEKRCLNFGKCFRKNETRRFIRKKRRLNQISNVLRIMKYTDEQTATIGENIIKA